MLKNKHSRVAGISVIGKSLKLLAAPITLLVISKNFSSEELAFYYTFFSLVSMQQLVELGIGHTMKQFITHSYKVEGGKWTAKSRCEIKGLFHFTKLWFLGVSLFILFGVGVSGYYYLGLSESNVIWKGAWICLILVSALTTQFSSIIILLDSVQKQEVVQKANMYSGLFGSIALWVSLSMGAGLYSIALSSLVILIISLAMTISKFNNINNKLELVEQAETTDEIFKKVIPLLSRVSVVWGLGFLFWNAFNLISFAVLSPNNAGKIIFCVTLAKSGMNVAESIIQSQMTIFSNMISNKDIGNAIKIFRKYMNISMGILFLGYISFIFVWFLFPDFYIFDKLPSPFVVLQVFLFFFLQLYKMLRTNFTRCFKVELFIKPSIFEAIIMPVTFYFSINSHFYDYAFMLCSIVIFIGAIWSLRIEKKFIKEVSCLI